MKFCYKCGMVMNELDGRWHCSECGNESIDFEISLQEEASEEEVYQRKLRRMVEGTPQYWSVLTDSSKANIIVSDLTCDSFTVTGEIEIEDVPQVEYCSWCSAPGPHRANCYNCGH